LGLPTVSWTVRLYVMQNKRGNIISGQPNLMDAGEGALSSAGCPVPFGSPAPSHSIHLPGETSAGLAKILRLMQPFLRATHAASGVEHRAEDDAIREHSDQYPKDHFSTPRGPA